MNIRAANGLRFSVFGFRFSDFPLASLILALAGLDSIQAEPNATLTVQSDLPGARINPHMWGVFFEDINLGADGGLSAELVKNRSFEFPQPLMGWRRIERDTAEVKLSVQGDQPLSPQNPHFLRMVIADAGTVAGIANEGFRGVGVRKGERYLFSMFARSVGEFPGPLVVGLTTEQGEVLGQVKIEKISNAWLQYQCAITASRDEPKAMLALLSGQPGTLDLDLVSLYPKHTWKNRPNGLRADLVQMLADLKPGFLRFPGGCIVEGHHLTNRYQWKATLGAPGDRPLMLNRWNNEIKHRPTPDYYQSFALGFYEYFLLCEDIGAAPLPILNCGMACQFNSGELAPLDQLDPYIQDALDLIEFANGPATSTWGRRRADMGHPKPFQLKLLGIGNEQWGPQYIERYERFTKVLKTRHPEIQLISSAGPDPDGEKFNFLWPKLRALNADLVDEHYYRPPQWFFDQAGRYDRYDRHGPKVFAGEYAAQSVRVVSPDNRNDWLCALAEAAMMTGFERNADVVRLASYAPLFAHVEGWQWTPNLIWFDNLRVFGTPNYYVQQLFSRNRGDVVLPVSLSASGAAPGKTNLFASATRDEKAGQIIVKVVNRSAEPAPLAIKLMGVSKVSAKAQATVLSAGKLTEENSLDQPRLVAPGTRKTSGLAPEFNFTFQPQSLTILRIKAK